MTVDEEILALSAAWDAALLANDAPAVASFMADEWVYVGPTGPTPKADIIGWIESGRLAHHTMRTIGPTRISVHGETVIVTARRASSGAWDGVRYTADEWITEVLIQRDGRWVSVFSQKCPVEI